MSEQKKYTTEERKMMKDLEKRAKIYSVLAFALLAIITYCLLNDKIDFSRCQKTKAQNLTEIGPRIQYVLQHSTPGVVWLLFCTFYVISKRVGTPAEVPTSGHEHLTESAKNIFLNSLEQFVMLFVSQLILVSYLTSKQVLNFIPTLNLLFIAGRITFWLGYPMNRSFGMTLNFAPLFVTMSYIGYRYITLFV